MKNLVLILGHPDEKSFNAALLDSYKNAAKRAGHQVEIIFTSEMNFDLKNYVSYSNTKKPLPLVLSAQEKIKKADHLVVFHPLWWGGFPSVLKEFFDQVFLPGFAFRYRKESVWWDKYLKGKTARIVCTADQPYFWYRFVNRRPAYWQLKKMIFQFCGINKIGYSFFGSIRNSTAEERRKYLQIVSDLGTKGI